MSAGYGKLLSALKSLLPGERLSLIGRVVRFIRRQRFVLSGAFVWATVMSRFSPGTPGFGAARQWYSALTGRSCEPRPFQLRFKAEEAVSLFEEAFESAVAPWRECRPIPHALSRHVVDIVVIDSTLIKVADSLRRKFKGLRNVPAQIKACLTISAVGSLPLFAELAPGTKNDPLLFPPVHLFRKGTLWLFDLGFLAFERLRELLQGGHLFICRIKTVSNPVIVAVRKGPSWARKAVREHEAIRLRSLLPAGKRIGRQWDLDVSITSHKAGCGVPLAVRVVIVPGRDGEQLGYFTNLRPDTWCPVAVREAYRLRWQIELVFKEMKQHLNLESIPTKDPFAAQVFVWASLIALAVSRVISRCLAPIASLVGLAASIRPALISRALRSTIRLLIPLLRGGNARAGVPPQMFFDDLKAQAKSTGGPRKDSFARLAEMLGPA
jgi:IS4 transposase